MKHRHTEILQQIWNSAIDAVSGRQAVKRRILQDTPFKPDLIIAVGKAASGMAIGAHQALGEIPPTLVVTKYSHTDATLESVDSVILYESSHPIPDEQSLLAGEELVKAVDGMSSHSKLLILVSGGASALAESLIDNLTLQDLQKISDELIASGAPIGDINTRRKSISRIKDGKLLARFKGEAIRVYAISDVEGDDIGTIGSGIGDCRRCSIEAQSSIVASNQIARQAAASKAEELGCHVSINSESLFADVYDLASSIGSSLSAIACQPKPEDNLTKVFIWGGEPTIKLPENPGSGGRNQSLALALSEEIKGLDNVTVLVAGTDGTDGPTDAAGGIVDGSVWHDSARDYLVAADAGTYLRNRDAIFITGPTNTNVMDLVIAIVN